jgi:hypothetical protein
MIEPALLAEARDHATSATRLQQLLDEHPSLAEIIATNASASENVLREIYSQGEPSHAALASNPNTPDAYLPQLSKDYPGEAIRNLKLLRYLDEKHDLCDRLSADFYKYCLSRPSPPPAVFWCALHSGWGGLRQLVAMHSEVTPEVVRLLSGDPQFRAHLLTRRNTSTFVLDDLLFYQEEYDAELMSAIAKHPNTNPESLAFLFRVGFSHDLQSHQPPKEASSLQDLKRLSGCGLFYRILLAGFVGLPEVISRELLHDAEPRVRLALTRNCQIARSVFEALSDDPDPRVKAELIKHPLMSPEKLHEMLYQTDIEVKVAVAVNPALPPQLVTQLARTESEVIGMALINRSDLTEEALCLLAVHPEEPVLLALLQRELPLRAMLYLAHASSSYVRERLAKREGLPAEVVSTLVKQENALIREALLSQPNLNLEALIELSKTKSKRVQMALAQHPQTPHSIMMKLAAQKDETIRLALSKNPNAPADVIEQLSKSKHPDVLLEVLKRPQLSVASLRRLSKLSIQALRRSILNHPSLSAKIIEELVTDSDANLRADIAMHEKAPPFVLELLAQDLDPNVSRLATEALRKTLPLTPKKKSRSALKP